MTEGFGENFVDELGVNSPVYTGTSITGDSGEALRIAIAEAKRQLHSSLVRWQLASLAGVNGGFVGQNDLTVVIHATPDSGRDADSAGPPDCWRWGLTSVTPTSSITDSSS